jgi:cyclopropane-fatty-acyl-phospholipid synthase
VSAARTAAAALRLIFGERCARDFSIVLWDGTVLAAQHESRFTLHVNDAGALRFAFRSPVDLNAGRAFVAGLLDCDGDIEAAVDELYSALERFPKRKLPRLLVLLLRLPKTKAGSLREARLRGRMHSLRRDRAAIGFHYDQSLGFYSAFLDRALVYSCGYFDDGVRSLDEAQIAKIDYTLQKLRLRSGETLLDVGCGWGALVIRAVQKFGARALGVTLSERQHEEANRRIADLGIGDRAAVELRDYRQITGTFDKIVSVGMFEHVGRSMLGSYFGNLFAKLQPGGLFLNHGIAAQTGRRAAGRARGFMGRFIFPDGELVTVSDALQIAERAGFEIRDLENLREHYVQTLRSWVQNLERNRNAAIAAAGEQAYRSWRLYLAGSAQGFRTGRLVLFQALLGKPTASGSVPLPATRRDLYASAQS